MRHRQTDRRIEGRRRTALTKLKALNRERVSCVLESIFHYPMTIVEAPIGYGKTTAVREFLSSKNSPALWLSFQSSEDTEAFFWEMFSKEISRLDEMAGDKLKSLGFPSDTPQTATILSILNDLDYEGNTAFVIDDFHLVKRGRVGALLKQIVKEAPEDLHFVVVTRDTSNFDFAELCSKGLCSILPQQILRFTDKEIQDYGNLMGFKATKSELKEICEYTGGWISLAYLILMGMEQGIPVGRNSVIDDLVEKVLYNIYDQSIRQFLLRLSVMDSFTAEQARYVTQEAKTVEFLKKLRRENAFITFNETAGVYIIHNVLLDFLRTKQGNEEETAALYRRVGEWHLKRKAYIQAYGYLYRAGETECVLASLDDEYTENNDFTPFEGIFELFAATPRELLFKYPVAYLQYVALLLVSGDFDTVQEGVSRLDELQHFYEGASELSSNRKNRILAEISVVRIFAMFNDAKAMVECTNEALRLLEGDASCLVKRESEFTFGSPHFLYSYYKEQGKLRETVDFMVSEFPAFARLASGCGTGCEYVTLAEYALEIGDWQKAELSALKAIYKAKTKGQTGIVICANLTLIRLYIYQGKTAEGLELLRQLREDVTRENSSVYNTSIELTEGYVYGCLGQPDKIPQWLRTGDMSPARFLYQGMALNYIVYGKAVLLSGNYVELEILTESFVPYLSIFGNQLGFLHNQILESAAKYRLYGIQEGSASLRKALGMAQDDHIILPFAEYAPAILDMIRHIANTDIRASYIKEVLRACEQYMECLKRIPRSTASLSARELEVLALAADGLKRDEIACKLNVSVGTVKTHLENVYRKLEVSGKTAAIKMAQQLKLL